MSKNIKSKDIENSDDSDLEDENFEEEEVDPRMYDENCWGQHIKEEGPDGVTFKSKKREFEDVIEKFKKGLKKGMVRNVLQSKVQVMDTSSKNGGTEIEIEVTHKCEENEKCETDSKRGLVTLTIWGKNSHKESTIMVNKHKKSDRKFVKSVAQDIIKYSIDALLKGDVMKNIFRRIPVQKANAESFKCFKCDKVFAKQNTLDNHNKVSHEEKENFRGSSLKCNYCEFSVEEEKGFEKIRSHEEDNHHAKYTRKSRSLFKCSECECIFKQKSEVDDHMKGEHSEETNQNSDSNKREAIEGKSENISPLKKKIKGDEEEEMDVNVVSEKPEDKIEIEILKDETEVKAVVNSDKKGRRKKYKKVSSDKKETKRQGKNMEDKVNAAETDSLPEYLHHLPKDVEKEVGKDFYIYKVPGDGLCAINAVAAHIFEDEVFGPMLRMSMNEHIVKNRYYYQNKGYNATKDSPFKRKVGNGLDVSFYDNEALYSFLKNKKDATYIWSDSEDLLAICNMYQTKIKVISKSINNNKSSSQVFWIYPDPLLEQQAIVGPGKIPVITLLHMRDIHFDLIIHKDSRLATEGSVSYRTNLYSNFREKSEDDVSIEDSSHSEDETTIKQLRKTVKELELSKKKLEYSYKNAEEKLKEMTEEMEKLKAENKNLRELSEKEVNANKENILEDAEMHDLEEEKRLVKLKSSGFSRNTPQIEASVRESVDREVEVSKSHDIQYNCQQCDFQTNAEMALTKHKILKHQNKENANKVIKCRDCESIFSDTWSLMNHRSENHKDKKKPCVKFLNGVCKFNDKCWWSHEIDRSITYKCSNCGEEFFRKQDIMLHKKQEHRDNCTPCKFEAKNQCRFGERCWFLHENKIVQKEKCSYGSKCENLKNNVGCPYVHQEGAVKPDFCFAAKNNKPPSQQ